MEASWPGSLSRPISPDRRSNQQLSDSVSILPRIHAGLLMPSRSLTLGAPPLTLRQISCPRSLVLFNLDTRQSSEGIPIEPFEIGTIDWLSWTKKSPFRMVHPQ